MIQTQDLEKLIYHTIDLAPPCDNSVVLGFLSVIDNPLLVQAVMQHVTKYYDLLLQTLPLDMADRIALQMQRCFTEEEYYLLFTRGTDFTKPIFKTLLITNRTEQLLFTCNRDRSYEAFATLLKSWSKVHNSVLYTFLYGSNFSTAQ